MLKVETSISRRQRTVAIYTAGGHCKIEGSLRKWLVRGLDLVSEDDQRC